MKEQLKRVMALFLALALVLIVLGSAILNKGADDP